MAERGGDVGLAGAGITDKQDVLVAVEVVAAHEVDNQRLVDAGLGGQVEGVEGFHDGKLRGTDAPFGGALLSFEAFARDLAFALAIHVLLVYPAIQGYCALCEAGNASVSQKQLIQGQRLNLLRNPENLRESAEEQLPPLLETGNHLVTRVRITAVGYHRAPKPESKKRGRPKLYGEKVKLRTLFEHPETFEVIDSPVYGEEKIQLRVLDLLWKPVGVLVRFVAIEHPTRGCCLLMCTDLTLDPVDIVRLYGYRFKIELAFKHALRVVGSFLYHFWMKNMDRLKHNTANQHLQPNLHGIHSGKPDIERAKASCRRVPSLRVLSMFSGFFSSSHRVHLRSCGVLPIDFNQNQRDAVWPHLKSNARLTRMNL